MIFFNTKDILSFNEIRLNPRSGDSDITKQFEIVKLRTVFLIIHAENPRLKSCILLFLSSIVAKGPKVRPQKEKRCLYEI
jgi:hypothetical protein